MPGYRFTNFENTKAWELAKAVQDEDVTNIERLVAENPKIINYQEPKYGNTLLMLTIGACCWATVAVAIPVQPLASVTVTV